ncbi:hypothetical protein BJX68DRAFT_32631 [Aspergillus pseudodeflectus]|uniref:Uncharacterized protein n=1 Tax=Aspergillus pseudodeflectus TaxID=176178 RepID=A0ABR4KR18_9EURO
MLKASPAYLLGGASLLSTIIVTILHGSCYASLRTSAAGDSLLEAVTVSLSLLSCVVVLALILVWANDSTIDPGAQQRWWKTGTYGFCIGYLLIATGITAGAIAWNTVQSEPTISPLRQALLIARCVIWAISVLGQGMLCGYLLTTLTNKKTNDNDQWSGLISHELEAILPSRSGTINKGASKATSVISDSQRPSMDSVPQHQSSILRTASQRSTRYSGRTLIQADSKPNSLDLEPMHISPPECAATRTSSHDQDSESSPSRPQQLQRSNSEIKRSLDSVMLRPFSFTPSHAPSSSTSSTETITPKRFLPKLKLPDESNIHPLFRSDSRSPPPTATPNTMVLASPDAGQTISVKTLQRMRSTRSVGTHTPRSRSPLFERADHDLSSDPLQRPDSVLSYNRSVSGPC